MESTTKSNYAFYKEHKAELLARYEGRYVAIANHEVVGTYDDQWEGFIETKKTHKPGTFIVQQVLAVDPIIYMLTPRFIPPPED